MTTFQAIVYAIVRGFTEFLPVGPGAHETIVPYLLDWPAPSGPVAGALALGCFLSVLIYFRHDWASIVSSFLQVIIFRKRPMTLDERLPLFLAISSLPAGLAWWYLKDHVIAGAGANPLIIAATLALFGIPLWFADYFSRKNKGMFDWNWFDALVLGIGQALMVFPGCGRTTGAMAAGLFRNYNREAAGKYCLFGAAPILAASAFKNLHLSSPEVVAQAGTTSLTLVIAGGVAMLAGLLAIGGFMKHIQRGGFRQYVVYRFLLAAGVVVVFWLRSRT